MRAYFISDNIDTFAGLKVSGINGVVVHSAEDTLNILKEITAKKDIGIIIFTEKTAALIPDRIKEMKLAKKGPLVVEIPDRHGTIKGEDSIINYVKESIGLKI